MAKQFGPATAGTSVSGTSGMGSGEEVAPFVSQVPGTAVDFPSFHGRAISWIAVTVIMVAFLIGGLALVFGPTWWLFWASLGLAAIGFLMALGCRIFDDWY
jgi:hypothetical protein